MEAPIEYAEMKPGQEERVSELIASVFNECVAPWYSAEGIAEFFKYANAEALAEQSRTNYFTIVASQNRKPVGVIHVRDDSHIAMFFVRTSLQNSGIGRSLMQRAIEECSGRNPMLEKMTVNSSPNSVPAYESMGFSPDDTERLVNGIRFTPMSLDLR